MYGLPSPPGGIRSPAVLGAILGGLLGLFAGGCENKVEWIDGDSGEPREPADEEAVFPVGMGGAFLTDQTGGREGDDPDDPQDVEPKGAGSTAPPRPPPALLTPEGIIWPDACDARWQYVCESYDPLDNCRCNQELPAEIAACGGYGALYCRHLLRAGLDVWVECECRPGAPNLPEDCLNPATFSCDHQSETGAGEQCSCQR